MLIGNKIFCLCRNDIFGTAGASHGLYVLASMFLDAGDVVFVEEATYFLALTMFSEMALQVVPSEYMCIYLSYVCLGMY